MLVGQARDDARRDVERRDAGVPEHLVALDVLLGNEEVQLDHEGELPHGRAQGEIGLEQVPGLEAHRTFGADVADDVRIQFEPVDDERVGDAELEVDRSRARLVVGPLPIALVVRLSGAPRRQLHAAKQRQVMCPVVPRPDAGEEQEVSEPARERVAEDPRRAQVVERAFAEVLECVRLERDAERPDLVHCVAPGEDTAELAGVLMHVLARLGEVEELHVGKTIELPELEPKARREHAGRDERSDRVDPTGSTAANRLTVRSGHPGRAEHNEERQQLEGGHTTATHRPPLSYSPRRTPCDIPGHNAGRMWPCRSRPGSRLASSPTNGHAVDVWRSHHLLGLLAVLAATATLVSGAVAGLGYVWCAPMSQASLHCCCPVDDDADTTDLIGRHCCEGRELADLPAGLADPSSDASVLPAAPHVVGWLPVQPGPGQPRVAPPSPAVRARGRPGGRVHRECSVYLI